MAEVKNTTFKLSYQDQDITEDISKYVSEVSYTDNTKEKADEIEITLDDTDKLFQEKWYPSKAAKIQAEIIDNGQTLYCGTFFIGEITVKGPPDISTWHATAIDPNSKIRTKTSKAFNEVTLLQIAQDIAKKHGLTLDDGTKTITLQNPSTTEEQAKLVKLAELFLKNSNEKNNTFFYTAIQNLMQELLKVINSLESKGYSSEGAELRDGVKNYLLDETGEASVKDDSTKKRLGSSKMSTLITNIKTRLRLAPAEQTRVIGLGLNKIFLKIATQNNETDLEYLKRISSRYGLAVNVKPPMLVFHSIFQLQSAPSSFTIDKTGVESYSVSDKTHDTFSDVDVQSHNPYTGQTVRNSKELQNTAQEQIQLASLSAYILKAGSLPYTGRVAFIRKAGESNSKLLVSLSQKGFGDLYDKLLGGYSLLFTELTPTACVRYSNLCKEIRQELLTIQASGNLRTKNIDAYAGGQSKNTLVVRVRAEDSEQADAIGKASLHAANSATRTGSLTMPGNTLAVAGNNFDFTGIGRMSGKYSIKSSTHTVTRGGTYTTTMEFEAGPVS